MQHLFPLEINCEVQGQAPLVDCPRDPACSLDNQIFVDNATQDEAIVYSDGVGEPLRRSRRGAARMQYPSGDTRLQHKLRVTHHRNHINGVREIPPGYHRCNTEESELTVPQTSWCTMSSIAPEVFQREVRPMSS